MCMWAKGAVLGWEGTGLFKVWVSVHRTPHLLCCRALEVQEVRLRTLRLASAALCKRLQFSGSQ
jgi:hypothetical protein